MAFCVVVDACSTLTDTDTRFQVIILKSNVRYDYLIAGDSVC